MLLIFIINSKCKHAIEVIQTSGAGFGICMQNCFGVGMRGTGKIVLISYIQMVVNFTVINNSKPLEMHGLMTAGNVKYGQPVMMKLKIVILEESLFIRTTMEKIF